MKKLKYPISALILLALLSAPSLGQETWPPDAAKFLGLSPEITFRWPGKKRENYYIQIYAGRTEVFSQEVKGNSLTVPLKPGPRYQWQVSKVVRGGYSSLVPTRSFQLSSDTDFNFSGKDGANGKDERGVQRQAGYRADDGGHGEDGQSGPNVHVTMEKVGDLIKLAVQGPTTTQRFFLLPGTPIQVTTVGGRGGTGGQGEAGPAGVFFLNQNDFFVQAYSSAPGPGGNGGDGGNGGSGGNVTIVSKGIGAEQVVQVTNHGGAGGQGGPPGPGGAPPIVPAYYGGPIPYQYQAPAAPGLPGRPGAPGQDGRVYHR